MPAHPNDGSSDVFFDWDDPATYPDALVGTALVYLVSPVLRVRYAAQVAGRPPSSFEAFARRNAAAGTTPEDK